MQKPSCRDPYGKVPEGSPPTHQPQPSSPPVPPARVSARHVAVLSLIALIPFVSGLIMLDPDKGMILGLSSISIMILPMAMLIC